MKASFSILCLALLFSGCIAEKEANPDEDFESFYQGSPQDFVEELTPPKNDVIEKTTSESFEFSGGNSDWQCSVTCSPR